MSTLCIDEHIHRYGLWCAARAVSKSLLSNREIKLLVDKIELREKLELLRYNAALSDTYYTEWLREMCKKTLDAFANLAFKKDKQKRMSYGLAAKIIAIYIKTAEVIPTRGKSLLSAIAHPPIDSILLRRFNKESGKKLETRWSMFRCEEYMKTIKALQEEKKDRSWWEMEVYWEKVK